MPSPQDELSAKYPGELRQLYAALKKVFSNLPLAAVVASNTLVLHGGLFRKAGRKHALRRPKKVRGGDGDDEHGDPIELGSLQVLGQLKCKSGLHLVLFCRR